MNPLQANARTIEELADLMTGGHTEDPKEAFEQWEAERQALAELFDDNQALTISVRRYQVTLALAEKAINAVEKDAAMFITQLSRNSITQFREQMRKIANLIANDKLIIAETNEHRHGNAIHKSDENE